MLEQDGEHGLGQGGPGLDQVQNDDDDPPRVEELPRSSGKRAVGRPKKVPNADSAQPAILRFLVGSSNVGKPSCVAGPSGGINTTTRVSSNTKTKDFIEEHKMGPVPRSSRKK